MQVKNAGYDSDDYLNEFGIKVEQNMAAITGRVLDPPSLEFHVQHACYQFQCIDITAVYQIIWSFAIFPQGSLRITPDDGVWRMNSAGFYKGADVKYWGIVIIADMRDQKPSLWYTLDINTELSIFPLSPFLWSTHSFSLSHTHSEK